MNDPPARMRRRGRHRRSEPDWQ